MNLAPNETQPGWTKYQTLSKPVSSKNQVWGWFSAYSLKEGYYHCMSPSNLTNDQYSDQIKMLQRTGYLDSVATKAVTISFTIFNIELDTYMAINLLFEKTNGFTYRVTKDQMVPMQLPMTSRKSLFGVAVMMLILLAIMFMLTLWTMVIIKLR